MSGPRERQRAIIEAVARRFCATPERSDGHPPGTRLAMGRKRVAIEIAPVGWTRAPPGPVARPRLRFDRVALALVRRLQAGLRESVPEGWAMLVTITAPIRLAARTTAALEHEIKARLARRAARWEIEDTVFGNRIRARCVRDVSRRASKVVGFVHNPESDPDFLLRMTESLLQRIGSAADRAPQGPADDRWLVLADETGLAHVQTYRHVYSRLAVPTGFEKVLLVLTDGRVETLDG